MPYSVFFRGGYAIHGTGYVKSLGRPVSHGCVRLHPRNAATLYRLVRSYGMGNTRIVIHRWPQDRHCQIGRPKKMIPTMLLVHSRQSQNGCAGRPIIDLMRRRRPTL